MDQSIAGHSGSLRVRRYDTERMTCLVKARNSSAGKTPRAAARRMRVRAEAFCRPFSMEMMKVRCHLRHTVLSDRCD